jgi:hypothetical protein
MIQLLVQFGADLEILNNDGKTPLQMNSIQVVWELGLNGLIKMKKE